MLRDRGAGGVRVGGPARRIALAVAVALAASACGVLTHAGGPSRHAWYPDQSALTPELVGGGTFGQMFSAAVDGQVYAQPVIANGVVFVATEKNNIYGIDATTGARQWSRNVGTPWNPADVACSDLVPSIGVTGTPVIDGATNTAYFFKKTYASGTSGPAAWYAHAVDVATGAERAGFPLLIQGTAANEPGKAFNPTTSLERTGLLLLDGVVYAGFGGHCDRQPYSGWVVGVTTGGVISTLWSAGSGAEAAAGIWQSGGGLVSDGPGSIYLATGNGEANMTPRPGDQPGPDLAQAVVHLRVQPDHSLRAVDFFEPYDADTLDAADQDLASGGPILLPATPFSTPAHPRLVAIAGKQGYLYLLDAADLGGMRQGPSGGDRIVARVGPFSGVWGQVAAWPGDGGYLYVLPPGIFSTVGIVRAFKWGVDGAGRPTLVEAGRAAESAHFGSTAAVVTSNGTTPGSALLWVVSRDLDGNGQLRAYDAVPVNGKLVMRWSGSFGKASKFSIPAVYGSRVYVGTQDGKLVSFGSPVTQPLAGGALTIPGVAVGQSRTASLVLTATSSLSVSAVSSSTPTFSVGTPTADTQPAQTGLPLSLVAGDKVTIPVTFRPTTPGSASGEIRITTSVRTVSIPVSSVGINATGLLQSTPQVLSFGGAAANGPPVTLGVSIANIGATDVTIQGVQSPGSPFAASGLPAVGSKIPPLGSITVTGSFTPTTLGSYEDALVLTTSAGLLSIPFSGVSAPPPVMTLSPTTVGFGTTLVGSTALRSFTVTNTGGTPLSISKSKPPGTGVGFVARSSLPEASVLAPGESVTETVTFTPAAPGTVSDTWILNGSDGGGERAITFTGTGATGTTISGPLTGGWSRNGAANVPFDPWLDLTGLGPLAAGSSFAPPTISASSVVVAFDTYTGLGSGGDGLALVFADPSRGATPAALGAGGGGLGFAGIPGVAVALDTFQNPGDPGGNAIGVTNGPAGSDPNRLHWIASTTQIPALRGAQHHVVVSVVGGYVTVTLDGAPVLAKSGVGMPASFLAGFTGGSGASTDSHLIANATITYR